MVLFLPYRTRAYREHFPFGTVALAVANALVFLAIWFEVLEAEQRRILVVRVSRHIPADEARDAPSFGGGAGGGVGA